MLVQVSQIDLSRPRVRYNGRVLDKCALSDLIHDVGYKVGLTTTYTDIYWNDIKYSELVHVLKYCLSFIS